MMAAPLSIRFRTRYALRALALGVAMTLGATQLHAADSAKRDVIGFSRDGKYFAFEQYGVQDGSGFPYSEIFVVEVAKDEWVRGTPARTLIRQDGAKLDQARENSRDRIAPYLWRLNIGTKGSHVVSDQAETADAAARFFAFTLPDNEDGPGLGTVRLRLIENALPAANCELTGEQTHGFTLVLESETGEPLRILEEDTEIPPSRGCPIHYGISDVVALQRAGAGPALVVLISMYRLGFEGLDRRFLAIGAAFDEPPVAAAYAPGTTPTREQVAPGTAPPKPPSEAPAAASKGGSFGQIPSYLINRGSTR
ncbi:MAG: hypothetical protein C0606_11875 [Hyphomicrobiales bacterium]|nr:MAG: hypothetical protein C0606_11875 [Hyphomicrobiales bacterium]